MPEGVRSGLLWPRPQEMVLGAGVFRLPSPLFFTVEGAAPWLGSCSHRAATVLRSAGLAVSHTGARDRAALVLSDMDALPPGSGMDAVHNQEGYAMSIGRRRVQLAGRDAGGMEHGLQTLAQILRRAQGAALPCLRIRDWPAFRLRGFHMYLPGRKQFDFFRRFLDCLAAHKYNTILLEISGGLEYERHPEISAAWREFCRVAREYDPTKHNVETFKQRHPRGPNALQGSRHYWKDSTHTELAGGDCLTKDELRWVVEECGQRGFEVIPEMQSLSHSYWLCCAHPDIAERRDDPFPDTYCPSNPKSYQLYFDCVEEVIEIVRPRTVSVGHDELYSLGICPKCRQKTGHELLAADVNRLHKFFAARGIRMMMWGDMLMKGIKRQNGSLLGGVKRTQTCPWTGKSWTIPATQKAAERIPKDVVIADWYWSYSPTSERDFNAHGFEVMYGNFAPRGFANWEKRANRPYVLGAEVSSWCEISAEAFAHNNIFHDVFAASDMLWNGRQMPAEQLAAEMAQRMPALIDEMKGRPRWLAGGAQGRARQIDITSAITPVSDVLAGKICCPGRLLTATGKAFSVHRDRRGFLSHGIVIGKSHPLAPPVRLARKAARLLFLHGTTMQDVYFQPTFYSYHRGPAEILTYIITYADGRRATVRARYGEEIGPIFGRWPQRGGVCPNAVPVFAGTEHTLYAQEWLNPRPNARIERITACVEKDAVESGDILVAAISAVE